MQDGKGLRSVVLVSGGLESACALMLELDRDEDSVLAVSVYHGQRHVYELACARLLCEHLEVEHLRLDLTVASSAMRLAANPSPADSLAERLLLIGGAAALADHIGAQRVVMSSVRPPKGFPSTASAFHEAAVAAVESSTGGRVRLDVPFLGLTKAEVIQTGNQLDVPWERTYSCRHNRQQHCGRCEQCMARISAFTEACIADPTSYDNPLFPSPTVGARARAMEV